MLWVYVDSTSLRSYRRSSLVIVAPQLIFSLGNPVTWVDVAGGRYIPHNDTMYILLHEAHPNLDLDQGGCDTLHLT